jgi:hypothetical protein
LDCIARVSFYNELVFKTVAPLLVATAIVLISACMVQNKRRWKNCVNALLILSYLILPGVSTTVFKTFPCESFDDGTTYLRADYSISCDASERKFMLLYALAGIVLYPIGIPVIYFTVLWRNRKALCPTGPSDSTLTLQQAIAARQAKAHQLSGLAFLYTSYKPCAWWYELFETGKRLVLTGFLVLFMAGSASQITLALLVMLLSIIVSSRYDPFINAADARLHFAAQIQTYIALLAGLLIQVSHNAAVK